MPLALASDVHAAAIDGDLVLLDVAADAYFCLADGGEVLALEASGAVRALQDVAVAPLVEAGLLTTEDPACSPFARRRPLRPVAGLDGKPAALTPWAAAGALRANARAAAAMRSLSFRDLVGLARQGRDRASEIPEATPQVLAEAQRFARMAPFLPHAGMCLMRSLQLLFYLRGRGLAAAWVFGVRTWPFEAHCWLQAGAVVLDDTVEHVQAFTPILAV